MLPCRPLNRLVGTRRPWACRILSLLSLSPNSFHPAKPSSRTLQAPLSQRPVAFFLLSPTSFPYLTPSDSRRQGSSHHLNAVWSSGLSLPLMCVSRLCSQLSLCGLLSSLELWLCLPSTSCRPRISDCVPWLIPSSPRPPPNMPVYRDGYPN